MQINLTPDLSLLAIMVIFIINYMVVRKFFLQPVNTVLEARETEKHTAEKLYETPWPASAKRRQTGRSAHRKACRAAARPFPRLGVRLSPSGCRKTHAEARRSSGSDEILGRDVVVAREQVVPNRSEARLAAERDFVRAVCDAPPSFVLLPSSGRAYARMKPSHKHTPAWPRDRPWGDQIS